MSDDQEFKRILKSIPNEWGRESGRTLDLHYEESQNGETGLNKHAFLIEKNPKHHHQCDNEESTIENII